MAKSPPLSKSAEFQLRVVESLTRLETLAEATADHMKRLNGSVARHEQNIGSLRQDLTEHPVQCPMRADVDQLKASALTEHTQAETNAVWWTRLSPIIWLAIGGIAVLFLLNAKSLLEALTHIGSVHP